MILGPTEIMHIRLASHSDLEQITNVANLAFQNAPLYDHFSPLHQVYPAQFRKFLRDEIRLRLVSPGQVIVVAENLVSNSSCSSSISEESKGKGEVWKESAARAGQELEIVGYAVWIKRNSKVIARDWNPDSLLKKFHRALLTIELLYNSVISPDLTTSLPTIHSFHSTAASILASASVAEHIELNTLAVHPARQRMGIGAQLMDWGMRKAAEHRLDIVLEATEAGVILYERKGFKVVGVVDLAAKEVQGRRISGLKIPVMVLGKR